MRNNWAPLCDVMGQICLHYCFAPQYAAPCLCLLHFRSHIVRQGRAARWLWAFKMLMKSKIRWKTWHARKKTGVLCASVCAGTGALCVHARVGRKVGAGTLRDATDAPAPPPPPPPPPPPFCSPGGGRNILPPPPPPAHSVFDCRCGDEMFFARHRL